MGSHGSPWEPFEESSWWGYPCQDTGPQLFSYCRTQNTCPTAWRNPFLQTWELKNSYLLSFSAHLHEVYFKTLPTCGQAPIPLSWDVVHRTHLLIIQQQMWQGHGALGVLAWLPKLPMVTCVFFHNIRAPSNLFNADISWGFKISSWNLYHTMASIVYHVFSGVRWTCVVEKSTSTGCTMPELPPCLTSLKESQRGN